MEGEDMHIAARKLCLSLAAMVSAMTANVHAAAASDAPAPQAIEEIQQLDEIWVRGKHLSRVIEDAEDDFFKLYNKLNKDQKYDVYCGVMALNSSSMIMIRSCTPGFLVYNYYSAATGTVSYSQPCSGVQSFTESNGDMYYMAGCSNQGYSYYEPPPAALVAMARRPEYEKNLVKVIGTDQRLVAMAKNLAGLYGEMALTQQHYVRVRKSTEPERHGRKRARPYISPRTL
jgi:hypothetical protein